MQSQRIQPIGELDKVSWFPFSDEPVLTGKWYVPRLSDPVFLFPEESPDKKWHLFAHSWLGIQHFVSNSGILWEPMKLVQVRGHSPFLLKEKGVFYLIYERHGSTIPFVEKLNKVSRKNLVTSSHIEMRSSNDLIVWSEPRILVDSKDFPHAKDYLRAPRISHPQMIAVEGGYRLYFGASTVRLSDSGHICWRYLLCSFSTSLAGPFEADPPGTMMEPIPNDLWRNLGCGRLAIVKGEEGFAAIQTGAYWDSARKRTASAMTLLYSSDGLNWHLSEKPVVLVPASRGWASQYITACDLRYKVDEGCWYCYFSATGEKKYGFTIESIGLLIGKDPVLRKPADTDGELFSK